MKHRFLYACVVMAALSLIPVASAQDQPDDPEGNERRPYSPPVISTNQELPPELVLPAGTLVIVRLTDPLSSNTNRASDDFTAILDQPLVAQGWVVARRGQTVIGRVEVAEKSSRNRKASQLGVALDEFMLVDGSQVPIQTELIQTSAGGHSRGNQAAGIGATTGIGAIIGAIAGGGKGAAIGAAIGAATGSAVVLSTPGKPTELYPETRLTFRLQTPVTIETRQAQQAFKPVGQADYDNAESSRTVKTYRNVEAYPPPPPPYYYPPYYYSRWGYFDYGPTIIIHSRDHRSHRGHRGRR